MEFRNRSFFQVSKSKKKPRTAHKKINRKQLKMSAVVDKRNVYILDDDSDKMVDNMHPAIRDNSMISMMLNWMVPSRIGSLKFPVNHDGQDHEVYIFVAHLLNEIPKDDDDDDDDMKKFNNRAISNDFDITVEVVKEIEQERYRELYDMSTTVVHSFKNGLVVFLSIKPKSHVLSFEDAAKKEIEKNVDDGMSQEELKAIMEKEVEELNQQMSLAGDGNPIMTSMGGVVVKKFPNLMISALCESARSTFDVIEKKSLERSVFEVMFNGYITSTGFLTNGPHGPCIVTEHVLNKKTGEPLPIIRISCGGFEIKYVTNDNNKNENDGVSGNADGLVIGDVRIVDISSLNDFKDFYAEREKEYRESEDTNADDDEYYATRPRFVVTPLYTLPTLPTLPNLSNHVFEKPSVPSETFSDYTLFSRFGVNDMCGGRYEACVARGVTVRPDGTYSYRNGGYNLDGGSDGGVVVREGVIAGVMVKSGTHKPVIQWL